MIESVENLEQVLEPYAGQTVWNEEDSKVYRWDPIEGWQEQPIDSTFTLSAYDMNKQIIGQLQTMDNDTINQKKRRD